MPSPSGKLTLTFPKATADLPPFEDYSMAGRTYRYAYREPLFPFGFGLSYTRFEYRALKITASGASISGFKAAVTLKNTGAVAADEVVQFYLSALETRLPAPLSQLIGFQRVRLKPGQSKTVRFTVTPEMLMLFDEDGQQKLGARKIPPDGGRLFTRRARPGAWRAPAGKRGIPSIIIRIRPSQTAHPKGTQPPRSPRRPFSGGCVPYRILNWKKRPASHFRVTAACAWPRSVT